MDIIVDDEFSKMAEKRKYLKDNEMKCVEVRYFVLES